MDSQTAQYLAAHIEAMREQTESINLLTKALCDQVDVISQLVNAVALLIDCGQEQDEGEQDEGEQDEGEQDEGLQGMYLMDGTRIS